MQENKARYPEFEQTSQDQMQFSLKASKLLSFSNQFFQKKYIIISNYLHVLRYLQKQVKLLVARHHCCLNGLGPNREEHFQRIHTIDPNFL